MPWRETSVMEERLRFVARLLEGEGMSDVRREFGISRKTGYKIFNRYKDDGLEALTDRMVLKPGTTGEMPSRSQQRRGRPHITSPNCVRRRVRAASAIVPGTLHVLQANQDWNSRSRISASGVFTGLLMKSGPFRRGPSTGVMSPSSATQTMRLSAGVIRQQLEPLMVASP